jgi:drug/metabolite transporter (DMT)-like permease
VANSRRLEVAVFLFGIDLFRDYHSVWDIGSTYRVTQTRRLHLKSIPMIMLSIVLGPMGNVMLGKGMKGIGSLSLNNFRDLLGIAVSVLCSPYIWLGIASLMAFMIVHMLLLTWADYSYVQPATSLSYATVALLSYFLLGEVVTPLRWLGIAVICLGVFIVGRTEPSTAGVHT